MHKQSKNWSGVQYPLTRKRRGRFNFFFASKEAYPIVRQLEKITVKKAQAKVVKCAKNKSWVPRNPSLGHVSVKYRVPFQQQIMGLSDYYRSYLKLTMMSLTGLIP